MGRQQICWCVITVLVFYLFVWVLFGVEVRRFLVVIALVCATYALFMVKETNPLTCLAL